ncbi:hypothetical protein P6B95_38620 [Streptomyces atratus]|uniref:hypothetical protein n=1 Tax=Streptomyces atratus TaxID=1893 RepID=UPI002AC33B05|nr:hypothetical protein [Streptomyces atratus]WPW32710.1 hypothetical protein P6B95_38620 [Streptomyces atratus]
MTKAADRGRLVLRMAGTSRAEQQQLLGHYTEQLTAATDEARRAQAAGEDALRQAAQLVQDSPYAGLLSDLGGTGDASPRDAAGMRQQFAAVRAQLPTVAERIDTERAETDRQARTQAVELQARAQSLRTASAAMRTEADLRGQIAAQAPHQHVQESAARDVALQQARRTAAQQAWFRRPQPFPVPDSGGRRR